MQKKVSHNSSVLHRLCVHDPSAPAQLYLVNGPNEGNHVNNKV